MNGSAEEDSVVTTEEIARLRSELEVARVDNARLSIELQTRTRDLEQSLEYQIAISDVLSAISSSPGELQPVLDTIVATAGRLCQADYAHCRLERDGQYHVVAFDSNMPGRVDHLRRPLIPDRGSLTGRVLDERRTIHVPDVLAEPEDTFALSIGTPARTLLGVPLLQDGSPLGVIGMFRREVRPFSAAQIELVTTFANQAVIAVSNARLFDQVQKRTVELEQALEQQTATSEVLKLISRSAFDLQTVLDTLIQSAAKLCCADMGTIRRRQGDSYEVAATYGYKPEGRDHVGQYPTVPDRGSVYGRTALEGRTVHIPDVLHDPEFGRPEAQRILGFRAALGVPLLRGDRQIGVIVLQRVKPGAFTPKQMELVETFADQAVIAIENTRLLSELRESLQQQTATADVLKVISRSAFDLHTVLQTLVESAARLCNADRANITRERNGAFYRAEGYGFSREFQEYAREAPIKPDRGSAFGRALLEGRAIHIPDVLSDPEYTYLEGQRLGAYRTVLAVPMLRDEGCTGVLSLTRSDVRPFTDKQVELATTFADQAAIAIENARLFEEVQARTRDLQQALEHQTATGEVLTVISRSPTDTGPVFDAIVDSASKLCNATFSVVWRYDGNLLHYAASHNFTPKVLALLSRNFPKRPDRSVAAGRAVLDRTVAHVPDMLADPSYDHELALAGDWRASIAVPMLQGGNPVGAISVGKAEAEPFSERQIQLLSTFADQAVIAIENARLFEQVQSRTRELQESLEYQTATAEVLNVISRSPNQLQPVLDTIVETAGRLCAADFGFAFRLQADGRFHLAAADQREPHLVEFLKRNPITVGGGSLTGRVAIERRTLHVPDARADPNYRWSEWLDISGFRTFLSVPLLRDGIVTGVIALARSEVKPFSDKQIELVTTFADQAVIAIENVRLFEEVQARTRELEESLNYQTATSDVLNVISRSAFDLPTVLDTLTASAARLCEADTAIIRRRDGELYPLAATYGLTAYQREHLAAYGTSPGRDSVFGRAILQRRTIHVPDITVDPEYGRPGLQGVVSMRAALGVPLLRDGVPVGVFTLQRREARPYSQKQIDLVSTFADQAVIAIENARLFNEVQARTQEVQESLEYQTATSDVLGVISRSPTTLQPVLEAIVRIAAELCEGFDATILLKDGDLLRVGAHHGPVPLDFETKTISPLWITGRAVLEGAPVHVRDFHASRDEYPEGYELAVRHGHRTGLAIPLIREGQPIGAFMIRRLEVKPFSDKQIQVLQTFADQAVIAISNVHLFEQVQARTRELEESLQQQTATADVLKAISRSAFDLQPVLETLVESATRLCDADHGWLFRRDGEFFHWVAGFGHVAEVHARLRAYFEPLDVPVNRGSVTGRAALEGRVVQIADVLADPEYTWGGAQDIGHYRAAMGIPLLRSDEVVGVIFLGRTRPEPFGYKQVELATTFADQAVIAIENVRLFEEVQARTRELQESLEYQTATSDVLNVISRSPSQMQPVLDTIVETASRLCDAYDAVLTLKDGEMLKLAAHHGPIPVDFTTWPIGRGWTAGRAVVDRRPIHVHDLAAVEDDFPEGQPMAIRLGHRTILSTPLLREGEAIGALSIRRTEVRPFSEKHIALIQTFADQAVIAIENARLFEEVQARTRELQESLEYQTATGEVLKAISRSVFDLQPVLDTLVATSARLCRAERGLLFQLVDGRYRLRASVGHSPEYKTFMEAHPIAPDAVHTVVGRTATERCVVHYEDVTNDERFSWPASQRLGDLRTCVGVPLLRDGEPIGVLALNRTRVEPFSPKEIDVVATFADQAVIAIENTRLFEEVQARTQELSRSVEELRALGEVSRAVNSTLDLETVLSTIVAKAAQLSATEAGAIYVFSKLRQEFRLRATYGMSEEMIAEIGQHSVGPGESYLGEATTRGEVIQVPDLQAEPPSTIRDLVLNAGYRALLVVPLLRPGRIVGALVVRRKEPGRFPGPIVDLLQTFASQSVVAIQNARLFEDVEARTRELANSLDELKAAQERLIQTEKLASLGQLTAGIAHEIKNPLNFVNNFAALSIELIDELKGAIGSAPQDEEQAAELMELLAGNLGKVVQHGKRADSIVKNMLLHSRAGSGERRVADINALVEESLNLAYHGARAEKQGFNVTIERSLDPSAGEVDVLPQEITRVFLNLISNGFYATVKRKEQAAASYEPTLSAATRNLGDQVEIRIRDNGTGIPPDVKEKMFNPFFTTKPAGEGTGLGLSLSHDIVVKQHRGSIEVDTSPGEYTEFRIVLPRSATLPANDEVMQ